MSREMKRTILFIYTILLFTFFFSPGKVRALELVAIDPGHGGEETGCIGTHGTREKEVTLIIAKRLEEMLKERLGIKTVITRSDDQFVDVFERTGIANNNKADIFISLHANSTFPPAQTGQIMIFINSIPDQDMRDAIMDENSVVHERGENGVALPWDKAQTKSQNESFRLAMLMAEESKKSGLWVDSFIKEAPIAVLKGANMPAFEVEIDFLTSLTGEERLNDQVFQERVCEVICRVISRFSYPFEGDPNAEIW